MLPHRELSAHTPTLYAGGQRQLALLKQLPLTLRNVVSFSGTWQVKIFTTVGTLILEGSRLVFTEENHNVADAFASAGFPIEGGAHRSLLGLYELVGFFNALNDLDESFGRA